ncbi:glucan endo-1,3-beta-glucosidase 14-like [Gastrolobium bilobum]|uniref:glucan endo-1,3-beta-glucosidase 14-like n=1 Tax=Gastrolobium bilobum TaxID=150636 RepID=UPI002AB2D9C8|nr:glucan endo-1,3-beta-glucosidase 14-like [Gastrolobium bilobum]
MQKIYIHTYIKKTLLARLVLLDNIISVMISYSFFLRSVLLLLLNISGLFVQIHGFSFGINYGQLASNLPSHSDVAVFVKSMNVNKIKLYDADPDVLLAFSNSNVEFIIGLGNEYLQNMTNPAQAQTWIQQHVQPYLSQTKITCISVGNEVFNSNDNQQMSNLLPAMQTLHKALVNLGLDQQVNVTTPHSFNILANSYPPSSGSFRQDLIQYIQPLLDFHAEFNSPFFINVYPFFAYKNNPNEINLDYTLFQPNSGLVDPNTTLHYDNMFYAQIDAVYAAIKALGHTNIEVKVSETGWPSNGDPDEAGATLQNAALYNGNLLKRIEQKEGTPSNPSVPIDVHVFALFNENLKFGPTSERNYGLFYPNGTPVYNIGLQGFLPQSKSYALSVNFLLSIITCLIFAWEFSRS